MPAGHGVESWVSDGCETQVEVDTWVVAFPKFCLFRTGSRNTGVSFQTIAHKHVFQFGPGGERRGCERGETGLDFFPRVKSPSVLGRREEEA